MDVKRHIFSHELKKTLVLNCLTLQIRTISTRFPQFAFFFVPDHPLSLLNITYELGLGFFLLLFVWQHVVISHKQNHMLHKVESETSICYGQIMGLNLKAPTICHPLFTHTHTDIRENAVKILNIFRLLWEKKWNKVELLDCVEEGSAFILCMLFPGLLNYQDMMY